MTSKQYHSVNYKQSHVLISRNCLALLLHSVETPQNGHDIFLDFLQQNSSCFWNSCLSRSVSSLEYKGYLVPCTLLISGTDFSLEVVRSAWARRILRPPKGYTINKLGDINVLEMVPAPQTHFAPLSEALCKVVADLNGECNKADTNAIRVKLEENFPEMQTPSDEILHKALNSLMREGKLYCTGNGGYCVSVSDAFRHQQSHERQMLMTNEEAIVKLHGNNELLTTENSSLVTQTSSDLQMTEIRMKKKKSEDLSYAHFHAGEGKQQSMLAKILRRMKSNKLTFSAQFPPPDTLLCHSVATQTQKEHKIPWGEFWRSGGDNMHFAAKSNTLQNRHSSNNSFKRRHRQKTSSSESSKISKSPAKFPIDKCESKSGSANFKPNSTHNPEKRHKNPKQYSKATKQVEKIQEVAPSDPSKDTATLAQSSEEIEKPHPEDNKQDITVDNTLSVELSPSKRNVSTTVVTEETTVTKGKVVTVTSITTSLSRNKSNKEVQKNDMNQDKISDLVNSCNIFEEIK